MKTTVLERLGAVRGASWAVLAVMEPCWAVLGPSWVVLGLSGDRLGAVLGPSWASWGPSWSRLGARLGAVLGPSCGVSLAYRGVLEASGILVRLQQA